MTRPGSRLQPLLNSGPTPAPTPSPQAAGGQAERFPQGPGGAAGGPTDLPTAGSDVFVVVTPATRGGGPGRRAGGAEGWGSRPDGLPNLPRRLPHTDRACSPQPGLRRGETDPERRGGWRARSGRGSKGCSRAAYLGAGAAAATSRAARGVPGSCAGASARAQCRLAAPSSVAGASGGGESRTGKEGAERTLRVTRELGRGAAGGAAASSRLLAAGVIERGGLAGGLERLDASRPPLGGRDWEAGPATLQWEGTREETKLLGPELHGATSRYYRCGPCCEQQCRWT